MPAPDYDPTDYDDALEAAKEAINVALTDASKDAALGRRLLQTAVGSVGFETWRPYAAAYRWLKANPEWATKLSGRAGGLEYRSLDDALAGLAEEQASEDARLGLIVPEYLKIASVSSVPGPTFTSWQ